MVKMVGVAAAATLAAAHVHPIVVSRGKTPGMVAVMVKVNHAASVAHKARAHRIATSRACRATKSSAKTRAARASTWASSTTTLTTVKIGKSVV